MSLFSRRLHQRRRQQRMRHPDQAPQVRQQPALQQHQRLEPGWQLSRLVWRREWSRELPGKAGWWHSCRLDNKWPLQRWLQPVQHVSCPAILFLSCFHVSWFLFNWTTCYRQRHEVYLVKNCKKKFFLKNQKQYETQKQSKYYNNKKCCLLLTTRSRIPYYSNSRHTAYLEPRLQTLKRSVSADRRLDLWEVSGWS